MPRTTKTDSIPRKKASDPAPERGKRVSIAALKSELSIYQTELEAQNDELREAQRSLELARSWYSSLFELAPVPYVVVNSDHTIRELNFAAVQILGEDRLRCRAARLGNYVDTDSQQTLWAHLEEVFHGALGERKAAFVRLLPAPGRERCELELYSFLVRYGVDDDPVCLMICFDVTERNRILSEMEHARRQAEAATASKAEFLSNMSHEMRTPLTSIMMFAQMAKRSQVAESRRTEYLDAVVRNSKHLNGLIGDILDVAKADAQKIRIEMRRTNLPALVKEVMDSLLPLALAKKISLSANVDPSAPQHILTDPTRLKQILINIVGNSVKFTQEGSVKVEVRLDHRAAQSFLQILVRDTGIGIPHHRKEGLFEQFYQADGSSTRIHGGTGIGLYLSRKIARLMSGDVELVTTVPGQGSVFAVSVPCILP